MFAQANIKCLMFQSLACPQSQSEFQSAMPIIAAATVNRDHFGKLPKPKQQQPQQHHRQQKQKHLQLACLTKLSSPSSSSDNTLGSLHLWGERACVLPPYCTFPQCTGAGSTTTSSSFILWQQPTHHLHHFHHHFREDRSRIGQVSTG